MAKLYTADEILAMPHDVAERAYATLREELEANYGHVDSHAARNHANYVSRLIGSGMCHAERAGAAQLEFERKCLEYHRGVYVKTMLAIWTGRYDEHLYMATSPCLTSEPDQQANYDRVCAARRERAGIAVDPEREARVDAECAEINAAWIRQRGRAPSRKHATELLATHGTVEAAAKAGDYDRFEFERRAKSYGLLPRG